jgi:GST-like protein
LRERKYVAGDFSIADVAIFPWVRVAKGHGIDIERYPHTKAWAERIATRRSTQIKPTRPGTDSRFKIFESSDDRVWATLFARETREES